MPPAYRRAWWNFGFRTGPPCGHGRPAGFRHLSPRAVAARQARNFAAL